MKMKSILAKGTAAALMSVLLVGCGATKIDPNATAVNINGGEETISLGYANFVAHYNQATYDLVYRSYFGDDYWSRDISGSGQTMENQVKDQVMSSLKGSFLAGKHAADYDVSISSEQEEEITVAAKKFMDENSEEAIKQMGATQEYVEQFLREQTIHKQVENKFKAAAEITITDDEAAQSSIAYTYFETTEFDEQSIQVDKSPEDIAKAKEHAEHLSKATGDFEEDVEAEGGEYKTYSFDRDQDPADEPYMDEAIIAAAQKLENGERSEPVEVENDGFYVVYMIDKSDKEATEKKKVEMEDSKRDEAYSKQLEEWAEDYEWEIDEKEWAKVRFVELFEELATPSEDAAEE